ncbi:MAG: hypothetical protein ABJA82_05335, partial [Myxococcales bacterium]
MATSYAPIMRGSPSGGSVTPVSSGTITDADKAAIAAAGPAPTPDGFYKARTKAEADALLARGVDPNKILTLQNAGGAEGSNNPPYYTGADAKAWHDEAHTDPVTGKTVIIKVNGEGTWAIKDGPGGKPDPATQQFNANTTGANRPPDVTPRTIGNTIFHPIDTAKMISGQAMSVINGNTANLPGNPYGTGSNSPSGGGTTPSQGYPGSTADTGGGVDGGPQVGTDAVRNSIANAQTLRQQLANAGGGSYVAPVVQGAQLAPQTYATAGQVGYVPQVQAPNVGPAQQVQAATVGAYLQAAGAAAQAGTATAQQIGALERVQAGSVGQYNGATAQQVGPIERVQGVDVQGAPQVTNGGPVIAERANATTLDQQQQAEFRQNQQTLLGYLNGAIDGTAPSVAKLQLDEATQRNEANQLGLASAASRGGNSALAMRTAANNIGMINQKAAADAALLRAQEIATARGQYGDVANSGRTTDVSIAGQNAGLQTGVSQSNAQLGTTANITGATLNQKTSSENAGNAVAVNSLRAQLAQAAQTTNANNNLSAGTTN